MVAAGYLAVSYSKYKAKRTELDGIKFASKHESECYATLRLLQRAKVISELRLQPKFPMRVNGVHVCEYRGDFAFLENGKQICADAKGFLTDVYKIKRALFAAVYPEWELREL